MFGRFTLRASTKELRNAFPFGDLPDLTARYNSAPVAAIRRYREAWFRWGFLPP
jgi:hypothetical protein